MVAESPCNPSQPSPCILERRRRCFIAPAPGRPRNDKAAPDVRAPVVRGRWHFWGGFGPFYLSQTGLLAARALESSDTGDIRWRMNEAIRPGAGAPPQAV